MKVETYGSVRVLAFDRPHILNALNRTEWEGLLSALRSAEIDTSIRCLVIRGEGRAFCAGNDIKETSLFKSKAEARSYFLDLMVPTLAAMADSRLPIIGQAHGMALGAGMEVLQFCDIVIAGESCRFQLPEVKIGLWATVYLGSASYAANRRETQYLALTAQPITAAEAKEAHIVTRVVPDDALEASVMELAQTIASNGADAVARSKAFIGRTMLREALPVVRDALVDLIDNTLQGDEGLEGIAAFKEKRPPNFAAPQHVAANNGAHTAGA
jgi:enoyl-CoA hydratase/carnithine racemase